MILSTILLIFAFILPFSLIMAVIDASREAKGKKAIMDLWERK